MTNTITTALCIPYRWLGAFSALRDSSFFHICRDLFANGRTGHVPLKTKAEVLEHNSARGRKLHAMSCVLGRWQLCWNQSPPATHRWLEAVKLGMDGDSVRFCDKYWRSALVCRLLWALCVQGMQHSTCWCRYRCGQPALEETHSISESSGRDCLLSGCCPGTGRRWATFHTCSCHAIYPQSGAFSSYRLGRWRQPWI